MKQIFRLAGQGETIKAISRSCGVSRNTVRFYVRRLQELDISISQALEMEDPVLHEKIFDDAQGKNMRREAFYAQAEYFLAELKRKGVTQGLLWEEYRVGNPQALGRSQFCYYLRQYQRVREAVMVQHHSPGERMEVDFTGEKLRYLDKSTGEVVVCDVFVATLCHSNLIFVRAVKSQCLENVIACCTAALEYFGGSPKTIVPDNLKSAVTKSNRYEPRINDVFLDMANHYGMAVIPARPCKPKDKPRVERSVSLVYQRLFAPLRNKYLGSLHELNIALAEENQKLNDRTMQQFQYSRRELFDQKEKDHLRPLPVESYQLRHFSQLTLQQNCHVYIRRRNQYYSAPFRFIGQKVQVICTENSVVIYYKSERIATHPDGILSKYNTIADHLPSHHRHYLAARNETELRDRAAGIGEEVIAAINIVLSRGRHPEQNYKTCQGILSLARKTQASVLREACCTAIQYNVVTYRNILRLTTGQYANRNPKPASSTLPDHENIRGKALFD